jgi:hypothetical protein
MIAMLKQFKKCVNVTKFGKQTESVVSLWAPMVVARNYMSVAHRDRDAVLGIISCLSSKALQLETLLVSLSDDTR